MNLTTEHWAQLVKLLRENGDLRAQLGALILGDEIPRAVECNDLPATRGNE